MKRKHDIPGIFGFWQFCKSLNRIYYGTSGPDLRQPKKPWSMGGRNFPKNLKIRTPRKIITFREVPEIVFVLSRQQNCFCAGSLSKTQENTFLVRALAFPGNPKSTFHLGKRKTLHCIPPSKTKVGVWYCLTDRYLPCTRILPRRRRLPARSYHLEAVPGWCESECSVSVPYCFVAVSSQQHPACMAPELVGLVQTHKLVG